MKIKLTPRQWEQILSVEILDADGWRGQNGKSFAEPIDLNEFIARYNESTVRDLRNASALPADKAELQARAIQALL